MEIINKINRKPIYKIPQQILLSLIYVCAVHNLYSWKILPNKLLKLKLLIWLSASSPSMQGSAVLLTWNPAGNLPNFGARHSGDQIEWVSHTSALMSVLPMCLLVPFLHLSTVEQVNYGDMLSISTLTRNWTWALCLWGWCGNAEPLLVVLVPWPIGPNSRSVCILLPLKANRPGVDL